MPARRQLHEVKGSVQEHFSWVDFRGCFLQSPLEKMQKSASFQKAMLNKKPPEPPIDHGNVEDVGKEELQGYEEPRRTRLKVLCILKS